MIVVELDLALLHRGDDDRSELGGVLDVIERVDEVDGRRSETREGPQVIVLQERSVVNNNVGRIIADDANYDIDIGLGVDVSSPLPKRPSTN